jgi:hypothetical protein
MYFVQYEKTLPPWYFGTDKVQAETSEDAVKEFYKRHDSFEERIRSVSKVQDTYQNNQIQKHNHRQHHLKSSMS